MAIKYKIKDKDLGWKRMQKAMKRMEGSDFHVLVGVFGDSGLGLIAGVHEFGAPSRNIPQRSFIRSTFDDNEKTYEDLIARGVGLIIDGKSSPRSFLVLVGAKMKRDVQKKITAIKSPPNKPATSKRKGSSNPLIDTGSLRNAIDFEVSK